MVCAGMFDPSYWGFIVELWFGGMFFGVGEDGLWRR